jgi:tape measure domain-containing protein
MDKELKIVISADDRATPTISKLENKLKGTSKEFDNTTISTQGFGSAITKANVIAGLAVEGIKALGTALINLGRDAIQSTADFEQSRIAFDTMLGSAAKGAKLMQEISDFAVKTPFELPELVDASKRLLAYNIEAEKIIPTMTMLGNITAGVGREKLPQLILAFGQVKASTKLTGAELRQFTEAGVPLLDALVKKANEGGGALVKVGGASKELTREAAKLNKKLDDQRFKLDYMAKNGDKGEKAYKNLEEQIKFTKAQIKDLGPISEGSFQKVQVTAEQMIEKISDGEVTFQQVEEALKTLSGEGGKFFNLMERQSNTFSGRLSNINDQFGRLQRSIMGMNEAGDIQEGGLFDRLSKGLLFFMESLDANSPQILEAFNYIGNAVMELGKFIGGAATDFWTKYGADITYVLQGLWDFIKFVVSGIVWIWQNDFAYIRTIITYVLDSIVSMFEGAFKVLLNILKFFVALFKGDWNAMFEAGKQILIGFLETINGLFNRIPTLIWEGLKLGYENLTKWLGDMWKSVSEWGDKVRNKIKDAFDWNKKGSPSYNDLMTETEKQSKKKLNIILDNGYMSRFGNSPTSSTPLTSNSVNINFNGNMSVRSDNDITAIAQEIKRMINREDVLFSKGLY